MDSVTFSAIADACVRSGSRDPPSATPGRLTYSSAARRLATLLTQFPDGVTHAMLFGGVAHRAPKEDKSWLVSSRHATADAVLELVVLALLGPTMLHVAVDAGLVGCSEAKASRGIVHALSEQRLLSLVGTSLLAPGRRLRLTGTAVAEVAANGDGALLLLPTPHAMLIAEPSFDRELLQSAASRTRGLSLAPDATLLLRLSHVTALETHAGRHLVRVLLHVPGRPCTPAEGEVEAELLLWNEEVRLGQLLPEHALLCVRQPELLTIGDAAVGGAPSQLGYAAHTLLLLVDESVPPSTVTAAGGGELRAFEGMRSDRGREARACEHERVAAGGMCLGRLMAPPQWQPGYVSAPAAAAADDGACGHDEGHAPPRTSTIDSASVRLHVYDGRFVVQVDLLETAGAAGEARRLCDSLCAGHHLFMSGLLATAPPAAPEGAEMGADGQPQARRALHGWLQPTAIAATACGEAGFASVINLSTLPAPLRSPRLFELAQHPSGWSGPLAPSAAARAACWPPLEEALRSGADALCCVAVMCSWTDGRAGGPLVERGGAGGGCSFVPVRLQLSDGLFGEFVLECAAREAVLEQLLDASAADLAPLPADEQRRSLDKQLCTERVWALTRAPSHGHGGAHLWTVNLTAPLDAVCPG